MEKLNSNSSTQSIPNKETETKQPKLEGLFQKATKVNQTEPSKAISPRLTSQLSWDLFEGIECSGSLTNSEKESIILTHLNSPILQMKHKESLISEIFRKNDKGFMLMKGVALVGSYLRKKKGIDNLYVCTSIEALQKGLNEISKIKEGRFAFVIPSELEEYDLEKGEYQDHKIAICVEKTSTETQIAILDADVEDWLIDSKDASSSFLKELEHTFINQDHPVLLYIMESQIYSPETTKVHFSITHRQNAHYGCETFALHDGISFLRDHDFFKKIISDTVTIDGHTFYRMLFLPPVFMRGTQSRALLKSYIEEYPRMLPEYASDVSHLEKSLQNSLEERNEYISLKSYKYHLIALTALLTLETQEIEKMISEAAIVAPYSPLVSGTSPEKLSSPQLTIKAKL